MSIILHITSQTTWEQARSAGEYRGDTLAREGFIHCSTPEQIIAVANRFYRGRQDLALLVIDRARVQAPVRDENLEGGETLFPHIYGPLNLDAVVEVVAFPPDADGGFSSWQS